MTKRDWAVCLVIAVWIISLTVVACGTQDYERNRVCVAVGYTEYDFGQGRCVQTESEDVRVYVSYELVLERVSNDG